MSDEYEERDPAIVERQFVELKDTGSLPSPSGVGMTILCLTQRDECSLDAIADTIMADPALTGQILKVANQGASGPVEPITTVRDAAVRLGTLAVSHVALGFTLLSANRAGTCESFDYDAYWSWSLACAVHGQVLGRAVGVSVPAQLFTAGLLLRIGELALASVHTGEYAQLLDATRKESSFDLLALELDRLGIDHCEVARELLKDWGLPADLCSAVAFAGTKKPVDRLSPEVATLVGLLRGAMRLADYCVEDDGLHHEHLSRLESVREDLGIEDEAFRRICAVGARDWRTWGGMLRVPTCTPPSVEDVRTRDSAPAPDAPGEAPADGTVKQPSRKAVTRSPRRGGSGLRVLAVDDDSLSLKLLATYLRASGHEVTTARNGKEALALALERNPQIVVTDWLMPEMDGLELTRALRRYETGRGIYVLILTGQEQEERVVEAFEAGIDDYVTKPFNPRVLLARVSAGQRVVRLQQQIEVDKRTQREQVARLAVLTRKLRAAAMTDSLTELPNRRYAMKRLDEEWALGARTGAPLSALLLDIDHFKAVNDRYGHDVGDRVLKQVASVIDETTREGDVTARIGGEEFLVICPCTETDGAMRCAERVRAAVEEHAFEGPEFRLHVTVSAGVATRGEGCDSIDALLKSADAATYAAKAAGRNAVHMWDRGSSGRRSA